MNKLTRFLKEKVLTALIQFTIGLILPWWVIDLINSQLVEGYVGKFYNYKKIIRYTVGIILPWWTLLGFQRNKTIVSAGTSSTLKKKKNK